MDVLIAYDIADTAGPGGARLRRIAEVCCSYGTRVQLSVFECRLSPDRYERLMGEIHDVIDPALDSVLVYRFPGRLAESRRHIGRKRPLYRELGEPWIL